MRAQIEKAAAESGFEAFGYVDISGIACHPEVRELCEGNVCRNYGASWACPPAVGSLSACRERAGRFRTMLLFSRSYPLEDSFDFDAMAAGMKHFKRLTDIFHEKLRAFLPSFQLLSNEGCGRCARCTYPDAPCRFPELLHHSLEGYGWIVKELADAAGIRYHNGPNTVTYFGALLFCETA